MSERRPDELLREVVRALGPFADELVFVGGAITWLLVTDPATTTRSTVDVDAIVAARTKREYYLALAPLRARGFEEDQREGAPLCRWRRDDLVLDVMPEAEDVLGFANRWYSAARETARVLRLDDHLAVRVVTAPCFVATKFDAFDGRGNRDWAVSKDLEDILVVADGREELLDELRASEPALQAFVAQWCRRLLDAHGRGDVLYGYFPGDAASQERCEEVIVPRLQAMASLG